jgi:hypothetical protein
MCPNQFQSHVVLFDLPNGIFKTVEKQWQYSSSLFYTILHRKTMRQMFTYAEFTMSFTETHFNQQDQFQGYPKFYENIV